MAGPFDSRRERLRFEEFAVEKRPDGIVRARVVLGWMSGQRFTGEWEGVGTSVGELRIAANASLAALEQFSERRVTFELLGVKAVRVFDVTLVIVSIVGTSADRSRRLIGSVLAETEPARGAALAVLNATNRWLGNVLYAP